MASVLVPLFTTLQLQYKLKSSFSKNNYCRTLPGTISCGSKPVIQITGKKEICTEKRLPIPKTSHKLSSSITTWLFPDTPRVQLQDTSAICIQHQFVLLTWSRLEHRQGDLLYIQDQNSCKENFGYVTKKKKKSQANAHHCLAVPAQ